MRSALPFLLLFLTACAEFPLAAREPAAIEEIVQFGEVEIKKSKVKIFPPTGREGSLRHFFYLELRDANGKLVDCDPADVSLQMENGSKLKFKLERSNKGKYYLTLLDSINLAQIKLKVLIRNVPLPQEVRMVLKKPDRNKSWVKAIRSEQSGYRLKLFLSDANGKAVNVPQAPEIIVEGQAVVDNLERVGEGTWEFDLTYPNTNQIIYVSIRAHGTYMADMFRLQHIEK